MKPPLLWLFSLALVILLVVAGPMVKYGTYSIISVFIGIKIGDFRVKIKDYVESVLLTVGATY